jgi:hypothetical protein
MGSFQKKGIGFYRTIRPQQNGYVLDADEYLESFKSEVKKHRKNDN